MSFTPSGEVAGSCDIPEQLLFGKVDQPWMRTGSCLCKRSVEAESSAQLQKIIYKFHHLLLEHLEIHLFNPLRVGNVLDESGSFDNIVVWSLGPVTLAITIRLRLA